MYSVLRTPLVVDASKCTGCRCCETACALEKKTDPKKPYMRVLRMDELDVNIPVIRIDCDLCDGNPRCVVACATGALEFMELQDAAKVRKGNRIGRLPAPIVSNEFRA